MIDKYIFANGQANNSDLLQITNPLTFRLSSCLCLTDYTQEMPRPKHDNDISDIIEVIRILNNTAPYKMPTYNYNIEEANGERYYKPDGNLLLVREYDSDVIRDYYFGGNTNNKELTVSRIQEHDQKTGRLRVRIEPVMRKQGVIKSNITIFDKKINNKYIIIQVTEEGVISNITEFIGKGKSFRALFRNINTLLPVRYMEGNENSEMGFEMLDCILDSNGAIARLRKYSKKREININYTETTKTISVKNKI